MKIYKLLPLILLLVCANAYGAYTGTMPKDIGTSTPLGSENPNVIDDVLREDRTVQVNLYKLKFVGTDTTLAANDSWVVGSSSTAMLITMPAASSCANSSVVKPFVITNYSTGTITLNISVDGVGSPTVAGSQTMSLFTDGTRWYEIRSKNAYDSDYLGGVIATGYARSGANSDITSITGLTTYLAIGQGGSGTNTAAGAASAFGVGTEDSPQFTGLNITSTGTVTTLNSTTGNVTNLLTTAGTVTTLNSTTGNITNQVTTTGTITTVNSTTGNITNLDTTTGTVTTLNSTTGNITTGNVTNLVTTTGTITTLNSTTGNITNLLTTTGTVTTLNSTTGNVTNLLTTTGTVTTLGSTNLTATTGTITTLNNTNLSGGAGTFTGNVNAASVSGFNYLVKWTTGSHTAGGTGTVRFLGTGDIVTSSTYDNNGNGTITHALAAGVSAKPDAKVDGVIQVSGPTAYDFPGAFFSIVGSSTDAVLTHKNISLSTQTSGLLSLSTQTSGNLPFTSMSGSATASQLPLISALSGSSTSTQLPSTSAFDVIQIRGTTTGQSSSANGQMYVLTNNIGKGLATFGTLTTTSLVSYYRLEDLIDSFGSNNLTNYGTTTFVSGKYRNCATFNGTSQYLQTGVLSTQTTNISMFGWVYIPSSSEARPFFNNGIDGADTNGYALGVGNTDFETAGNNLVGQVHGVAVFNFATAIGTGWHHVGMTRDGTTWRGYIDKIQCVTTFTNNPVAPSGNFTIGRNFNGGVHWYYNDKIDDVVFYNKTLSAGEIKELYDNTGGTGIYTQYSARYIDPVNGNTILQIETSGTNTLEANYIYCNATTTVFGLGTNTAITATSTAYSGWFDGAVRATAFNVASTEKIKENIKPIRIKPDLLDAEGLAKQNYITGAKVAWMAANQANYTTVINETGTGSVAAVDVSTMESDYNNYIEFEWASDLNQDSYIENIQKTYEKGFWEMFDSVTPKSWNPQNQPTLTRKGFVVEDMPDVVKGDDGQSLDPMALIAYISLVQQTIKADTIFALNTLKELITTGTVTQQKIDYVQDRLDVLNP